MAALWPSENVRGGAHVQDGIVSYLPDCSSIQYGAISASGAAQYDITTVDYVVDVSRRKWNGMAAAAGRWAVGGWLVNCRRGVLCRSACPAAGDEHGASHPPTPPQPPPPIPPHGGMQQLIPTISNRSPPCSNWSRP